MEKPGILLVDKEDLAGLEEEIILENWDFIRNVEIIHDPKKSVEFLKKECGISEKGKCPEFVIIDLGMASPEENDFLNLLKNINQAREMKIQVILLVDKRNKIEINKISGLGIDYIRKPLTKESLERIFERNDRLRNLEGFI